MEITEAQFEKISKNCPFRSKSLSTMHLPGGEVLRFFSCKVLPMVPNKFDWDRCEIDNCAISYWIEALEHIKDDE